MTTELKSTTFTATGGTTARALQDRLADRRNALEVGVAGNGSTDDTAAIQAAIDATSSAAIQGTFLPGGHQYKITTSLFLDVPSNLRSSLSTPTIFNFSLALTGDDANGNHEGYGTWLRPSFNNSVALWIGPGQGMRVAGISISPSAPSSLAALPNTGAAIAIAGGGGGASGTSVERCFVENMYYAYITGFNSDSLADSNTFFKCDAVNCVVGYNFSATQNYINSLIDCRAGGCKVGVQSYVGKSVNIYGGNYSKSGGAYASLTIGSVSGLTSFSDSYFGNTFTNWTFTAVFSTEPSAGLGLVTMPDGTHGIGNYDRFAVETTSFGAIPLLCTAYNSGTKTGTFKFQPVWLNFNYANADISSVTDIATELAAVTTMHCCELATTFAGPVHVRGVHVENSTALTRVLHANAGFTGDVGCSLEDVVLDWEPGMDAYVGSSPQRALVVCQQVHPFIEISNLPAKITRGQWANGTQPICIDINAAMDFEVENVGGSICAPNVRLFYGYSYGFQTRVRGGGIWDKNVFRARGLKGTSVDDQWDQNSGNVTFLGWHPQTTQTPQLTPTQITAYSSLGSIGTYPALHGGTRYAVDDYGGGSRTTLWARSEHDFLSYGQNITVNWSFKGGSTVITLADTSLFRAGLKIRPQNSSGLTAWYTVTGVYPALGYITVCRLPEGGSTYLEGTSTTTYTGTVIEQEAYTIQQF